VAVRHAIEWTGYRRRIALLTTCLYLAGLGVSSQAASEGWLHLDNGTLRLGVNTNAGACIGFFSESKTGRNLLNHHDHGRFIQQSWYGASDDSLWNDKPWRWNPVQGGDWRGNPTMLLELRHTQINLYAKTRPKHWASGADITDGVMEEWITLDGEVAHLRFKFTYTGAVDHPPHHQELPAVFMDFALTNLVFYRGDRPWTGAPLTRVVPGWPNQQERIDEPWAAYVNDHDWGLGVFVPGVREITCYRHPGEAGPKGGGCSYFAPIRTLAITNGFTFDYDVYLAIGEVNDMRTRFQQLRAVTK
jgi:hypothetical protein